MMVVDGSFLIKLLDIFGCICSGGLAVLLSNILYAISRSKINFIVSQIYALIGFYSCLIIFSIFWHYDAAFKFFCGYGSLLIMQFKIEPDNDEYAKNFSLPKFSWIKIL